MINKINSGEPKNQELENESLKLVNYTTSIIKFSNAN